MQAAIETMGAERGQGGMDRSTGGRLVTAEGRELPVRAVTLGAEAHAGLARVVLSQRFANPGAEPLAVTYQVPLPADAAVSGYAFTIGERRVVGAIDRRAAARERYEEALLEGRSAALLEQDRANLFTQELGNVPPGADVTVEISVDQPLRWVEPGSWEWRFPTVVAPRYLGAPGRVADAARVTVDVLDGPTGAGATLALVIRDALAEGAVPESTSHSVVIERGLEARVSLGAAAALDRDVVVRWRVARPAVGLEVAAARVASDPVAYALLTVVPPAEPSAADVLPRDLVVLLDTSGSMEGAPLARAKAITAALVRSLGERDRLELIEFSMAPRRWKKSVLPATEANRKDALGWIAKLAASGGTEMRSALIEALAPLSAEAQRQVVLVTDGHIGFESEVVREVRDRLPAGSRLHTVGVGSSVNRGLTRPAARAGRGVEVILDLDEDAERGGARLVAATRAPLVVDLVIDGDAVVERATRTLTDLTAGAPALVPVSVRPEGGTIRVQGRTPAGTWTETLTLAPIGAGTGNAAVRALFGRERVEDLELDLAAGANLAETERAIEALGLSFSISTRATSWVATTDEPLVDPRDPIRHVTMPHELPYGLSATGLGLRGASMRTLHTMAGYAPAPMMAGPATTGGLPAAPPPPASRTKGGFFRRAREEKAKAPAPSMPPMAPRPQGARRGPPSGQSAGRLVLPGRVLAARPQRLAVAVDAGPFALDWQPALFAELRLADGTFVTARVDLGASTRACRVEAGRSVRLVLILSAPLTDTVEAISLSSGAEVLEIELA